MPSQLQTTIAGSLPKPSWLSPPNQLWAPWLLEGAQLAEAKRVAVRLAVGDQERAGIDIVTDGEIRRESNHNSLPQRHSHPGNQRYRNRLQKSKVD